MKARAAILFTGRRACVLGLLVWLPLLACPLMDFFMHGEPATITEPGSS